MMTKILAFAGSSRKDSFNRRLLAVAAAGAERAGATVTIAHLGDYPMPIFDEDLEAAEGLPTTVLAFRDLMLAADGLLIASPEYNSSFSALLKNTIDWASRPRPGEAPLACFRGKIAGLVAASPGYFGGYRGLQQVRYLLGNIGTVVLPDMFSLPQSHEAFHADGSMKDDKKAAAAMAIGENVVRHIALRK
jgi:NAD(P)H-dependent FMN reductase